MTPSRTRLLRWLLPVGTAAALTVGTITISSIAAAGSDALPPRSAAQLLVDVQQASVGAISGTVVQTSDLGIPDLPGLDAGGDSSNLTSLVSGTHTLRIWYDGTDKARIAVLGTLGESDVIKNGKDLWTWSSKDNAATHRTVSMSGATTGERSRAGGHAPAPIDPTDMPKTPQEAADAVLKAIDPSTSVTPEGTSTVAGRPAYQLTLRPRDTRSLVAGVSIAIDAEKHIPLRVQVFAVDHRLPAFEIAFSAVNFSTPDAAQFNFDPPPGAKVTQATASGTDRAGVRAGQAGDGTSRADAGGSMAGAKAPTTVGTGWTTVVTASTSSMPTNGSLDRVLGALPEVSGSWGSGRLFSGTLFSAVLTSDGRIAVGAVRPAVLYAALTAR